MRPGAVLELLVLAMTTSHCHGQECPAAKAPTNSAGCGTSSTYPMFVREANMQPDCLTEISGACVPTAYVNDDFCDERLRCSDSSGGDTACNAAWRAAGIPETPHSSAESSGGLLVTDPESARLLAYEPNVEGAWAAEDAGGDYQILYERAPMETFSLVRALVQ
jgi:hypothetical protein